MLADLMEAGFETRNEECVPSYAACVHGTLAASLIGALFCIYRT